MFYKVVKLDATQNAEPQFDYEYHQKYIGKIAEEMQHNFKPSIYKDFKLLVFGKDNNGRVTDADWIHKDDVIEIDITLDEDG
ncbi:MAG: hypothetical protein ABFD25_00910 [Clostridiaceae bacterium]